MTAFFFIILFLSMAHFLYEGIIAPSIRLHRRFRLFQLRDQLRDLRAAEPDCISEEAFDLLDNRINTGLKILPFLHLSTVIEIETSSKDDPELVKEIERRQRIMDECVSDDARKIGNATFREMSSALATNSLGAIFYSALFILPVMLCYSFINKSAQAITTVLLIPAKEIDAAINLNRYAVA